jgi:hypothetical protein
MTPIEKKEGERNEIIKELIKIAMNKQNEIR